MKIELYRQSGNPTSTEDRDKYDVAFKELYDKAAERAGLDMLKLNRMVRYGERQLIKKFNQKVEVDLPKSSKAWKRLSDAYEGCPIMVAVNAKSGASILVIMDALN